VTGISTTVLIGSSTLAYFRHDTIVKIATCLAANADNQGIRQIVFRRVIPPFPPRVVVNVKHWTPKALPKKPDLTVKAVLPLPGVTPEFVLEEALRRLSKKMLFESG